MGSTSISWSDRVFFLMLEGIGLGIWLIPMPALAQITPDNTLGAEGSVVTEDVEVRGALADLIEGGAIRDTNLFHSFLEFNVDEGQRVYFDNPDAIANIFSRVTGADPSNILGTLGVDGAANLFFLNPNGIIFGPNASLDIEGSFVGSTAESFIFPDGTEFSAVNPDPSSLLTISVPLGLQYGPNPPGSTIANQGQLATGQTFTLVADVLDLRGQILSGGDLTLHATDTLQIRDAMDTPFIAASMGEMLVQGDRTVDIFALSHPDSGLFSGSNMTLRSANPVGGDAHYWSGGNFRIEQLNESLGDLLSPYDPIIRVAGDLTFNNYIGSSLHIIAGGSVVIPGTVVILDVDTPFNSISERITLSDGTIVDIDGAARPTLDIRAGVNPSIVDIPGGFELIGDGFFPGGGEFFINPTTAAIIIGSIIIEPPNGQVLLTNQYFPNNELTLLPNIFITGDGIARLDITPPVQGIDARGFGGDGSSVTLDSRGDILIFNGASIDSSSQLNDSGNIRLIAGANISLASTASISGFSNMGRGGNIHLSAQQRTTLNDFSSIVTNSGGNIEIQSAQLNMERLSQLSSVVINEIAGGDISIEVPDLVRVNGGNIATLVINIPGVPGEFGDSGDIVIETRQLEVIGDSLFVGEPETGIFLTGGDIAADVSGSASAGDILINAEQVTLTRGGQIRASTFGSGNAGNINIFASDTLLVSGTISEPFNTSKISTTVNNLATGRGGDLLIETNRLVVSNGAQVQAGAFGIGLGGSITVNANQSIDVFDEINDENPTGFFTGPEGVFASGRSGDITVNTSRLRLVGSDSRISNEVDQLALGDAGDTLITVDQLIIEDGGRISTGTLGTGQAGDLTINASESINIVGTSDFEVGEEPSSIFTATAGFVNGGDLTLNTGQLVIRDGGAITASTFGLNREEMEFSRGGNITINSTESVNLIGQSSSGRLSSSVNSEAGRLFNISNSNSSASGGNIFISTRILDLQDTAEISTSTFGEGNAGSLSINASEEILLTDRSRIAATVGIAATGDSSPITLQTSQLSLVDSSQVSAATFGNGNAGIIEVLGTDSVLLDNSLISTDIARGAIASQSSSISIDTRSLQLTNDASITATTSGEGDAGDVSVVNADLITLSDSSITTTVNRNAIGRGGNIEFQTEQLELERSNISSSTIGRGDSGQVEVNASDRILLFSNSSITTAVEEGAIGDAQRIVLRTPQLFLRGGSQISAATSGEGNAGEIQALEADSIRLSNSNISTAINSTATTTQPSSISIDTRSLQLTNNANITASTSGEGDAGDISVMNADLITLSDSSITTTVNRNAIGQGGNIQVSTAQVDLNQSEISSSTFGQGNSGQVDIRASEGVLLFNESDIATSVGRNAVGDSQQIILQTPQLVLRGDSQISAATLGEGNAGAVRVSDADSIQLSNSSISTAIGRSAIATQPSNITIDTRSLRLNNDANITASTAGQGRAGNITIDNADIVFLEGGSAIASEVAATGRGRGGTLRIQADSLNLTDQSSITASTEGRGRAGSIFITGVDLSGDRASQIRTATSSNQNAGDITVVTSNSVALDGSNTGIFANTERDSGGDGGDIAVHTQHLSVTNEAEISSESLGEGTAGNVEIQADEKLQLESGRIATSAERSAGGAIEISAGDIFLSGTSDITTNVASGTDSGGNIEITTVNVQLRDDSDITTNVSGGTGDGGNIAIAANAIIAFDDSDIISSAPLGSGGNITLDTLAFFGNGFTLASLDANPDDLDNNDRVDINATGAVAGIVALPDVSFIQNSLNDLPESLINTEDLIANSCVVQNEDGSSTFMVTGPGGLPERPGDAASDYPTGEVQTIPDESSQQDNTWQIGDPIIEPNGVYQLPTGELIMTHDCRLSR